ncbi:MAG: helix-turn-helix domain-containing protein [Thermoleophilaceae bacterium]
MPDAPETGSLRRARESAGLSQTDLARHAEVSRALIGSIERGRHVPAVDAAMRIADVLGASVESLFAAPSNTSPTPVLGRPLADGAAVRAGQVGERVVVASVPAGDASGAGFTAPDGRMDDGRLTLFSGGRDTGLVVAGCDPALGVAAALLSARGPERLVPVATTSGWALEALAAGRCHGVLVHERARHLPRVPSGVRRWHVTRWRAGLAYERSLGEPSLEALLSDRVSLVQREASAASQKALERAAGALGVDPAPVGPTATGHLEAAQRAAWSAGAAVTIEPAADAHGLAFLPFETHVVELWVTERWHEHPGVAALVEVLASGAFRDRVDQHDGYDLNGCGTVAV